MLGPQNCGKSALVRAVIKTMQRMHGGQLQPIYIDGRMGELGIKIDFPP
jgi:hypothetical protein